jgi:heme-degrading monooxygenase HmoA
MMFARVTMVAPIPDKSDEAIRLFRESIIPAAKSQKGFRKAYFLNNRETGEGIFMTLWESKEDGIASEKTGYYQEQLDKFQGLLAATPAFDAYYEVSVDA